MSHDNAHTQFPEFPQFKRRRLDSVEPGTSTGKAQAVKPNSTARRWALDGSIREIDQAGCYYLDPGLQPASIDCLDAVQYRQYVLLSGARASGKSTRLLWLKKELESIGYCTK
jgi:hypothetical protein